MIDRDALKLALSALLDIEANGPVYPEAGLCVNVVHYKNGDATQALKELMAAVCDEAQSFRSGIVPGYEWYSGNREFPVRHPYYSPSVAFLKAEKWDGGEYGANRKIMLKALINKAKDWMK
jgi:hypothetical protein